MTSATASGIAPRAIGNAMANGGIGQADAASRRRRASAVDRQIDTC